jgi:O-glycosyl hydrolase
LLTYHHASCCDKYTNYCLLSWSFSILRVLTTTPYISGFIPYVKRASHISNRAIRLQATLDYYPSWMLAGGAKGLPSPDLNATLMTTIGNYYLKFVEAINQEGLQLDYLSLYNELTSSYMNASYDHTRTLLLDYVKPLFQERLKRPPKLTWTEKYGRRNTVETSHRFFEMEGTNEAMDVLFYHGYDCGDHGGWQCDGLNTTCPKLHESAEMLKTFYNHYNSDAKRPVWMTELCYASEFGDYNYQTNCPKLPRMDFTDALQWGEMLFTDFNVIESNAWIYWNMILDMNGGPWLISPPHNDPLQNPQQALIHADLQTGEYTLTGSYYAMWHFGRIPINSVRHTISTPSPTPIYPTLRSIAWEDKQGDGSMTVVLMNKDSNAHEVSLTIAGREGVVKVQMPAISIMTVVVK